jgi:hypothetical protein
MFMHEAWLIMISSVYPTSPRIQYREHNIIEAQTWGINNPSHLAYLHMYTACQNMVIIASSYMYKWHM